MELLIDGVRYKLWTPKDEAALEDMVKEHAKDIFGEDSIYFDIKPTLRSQAGIGSKPDGYVIAFEDTPQWYIVEVELSSHPLHEHIMPQMSRFSMAIENLNTQRLIVDATYQQIKSDVSKRSLVQNKIGAQEIHEFLSGLISSPPVLVIVIEEVTKELEEVCAGLPLKVEVVEFKTFERGGVGLVVHAHLFEPIWKEVRGEEKIPKEMWSKQEILEFWDSLTEGAKDALRVIAKQPDGCPRDDVLKELGIDGYQLAGRLSSVGHALRNFPTKLRPVELDWSTWKYKMLPELSRAVAELSQ